MRNLDEKKYQLVEFYGKKGFVLNDSNNNYTI